jgi:hypothetical protein
MLSVGVYGFGESAPARDGGDRGEKTPKEGEAADIDLLAVSRLHQSFERLCLQPGLQVHYAGTLSVPRGKLGMKPADAESDLLKWELVRFDDDRSLRPVLAKLTVSSNRVDKTDTQIRIRGKAFFIHVSSVKDDLDAPIPNLERLMLRAVIAELSSLDGKEVVEPGTGPR